MPRKLVGVPAALFGLMLWAGAAGATLAGTVIGVSGSCTDHGRVLNRGDQVQIGDPLDVPADGKLKLQTVDGSVVTAAQDSTITVARDTIDGSVHNIKLSLTQGVLHVISTTRLFEVSTPVGTAAAASDSADWFIKAESGSAQVGVLGGMVDFTSNLTGHSVSIPARWGTRLEAGRAPMPPRIWSQMEFNAVIRLTQ
jgi:hypothetical protein